MVAHAILFVLSCTGSFDRISTNLGFHFNKTLVIVFNMIARVICNIQIICSQLLRHGVGLSTGTDSELITQLLTHTPDCGEPNGANWVGR